MNRKQMQERSSSSRVGDFEVEIVVVVVVVDSACRVLSYPSNVRAVRAVLVVYPAACGNPASWPARFEPPVHAHSPLGPSARLRARAPASSSASASASSSASAHIIYRLKIVEYELNIFLFLFKYCPELDVARRNAVLMMRCRYGFASDDEVARALATEARNTPEDGEYNSLILMSINIHRRIDQRKMCLAMGSATSVSLCVKVKT